MHHAGLAQLHLMPHLPWVVQFGTQLSTWLYFSTCPALYHLHLLRMSPLPRPHVPFPSPLPRSSSNYFYSHIKTQKSHKAVRPRTKLNYLRPNMKEKNQS